MGFRINVTIKIIDHHNFVRCYDDLFILIITKYLCHFNKIYFCKK